MSDIFFTNKDEVPVPPDEVRIRSLEAQPRPDGARIVVKFAVTPFVHRPNIELSIVNAQGDEVSTLSVVEAIDAEMDFTMHLRQANTAGHYTLLMQVFYADLEGNAPDEGQTPSSGEILSKARQVVDQKEVEFDIPAGGAN